MIKVSRVRKIDEYEKALRKLQVELCALQDWVKHEGLRVVVVFEGRDAAGKGGTIKAITERVSPRVFRVVALPAPSDRERGQLYLQRYIAHLPTAGEILLLGICPINEISLRATLDFLRRSSDRRHADCRARRFWQCGDDRRPVLRHRSDRGAVSAGDERQAATACAMA